ncbi:hypothetical protein BpHYR1_040877 [Brachionus plicatilis]|uniref:Uncharacterized protein n=1 Tax=Brachionus plicatilis TaxID=10195 RepID=A0A3M7T8D9_BRAPC|nr:hypothetical protein BpHYR1_040877 [Brachionus plicatilis]
MYILLGYLMQKISHISEFSCNFSIKVFTILLPSSKFFKSGLGLNLRLLVLSVQRVEFSLRRDKPNCDNPKIKKKLPFKTCNKLILAYILTYNKNLASANTHYNVRLFNRIFGTDWIKVMD